MSIITISVGQCGNQIQKSFYDTLYQNFKEIVKTVPQTTFNETVCVFFNATNKGLEARCVQIDMEKKSIEYARSNALKSKSWRYPDNYIHCSSGSANNWAMGYSYGYQMIKSQINDSIRLELEKSDRVDAVLTLFSLSGGTGSGITTSLSEAFNEEFGSKVSNNLVAIWPFIHGEIPVQWYNTLLSLGHLLKDGSSSIINLKNDSLSDYCQRQLNTEKVTINEVNSLIARLLTGFVLPSKKGKSVNSFPVSDIVQDLCPSVYHKMLRIGTLPYYSEKISPFSVDNWQTITSETEELYKSNMGLSSGSGHRYRVQEYTRDFEAIPSKIISSCTLMRGPNSNEISSESTSVRHSQINLSKHLRSATMMVNGGGLNFSNQSLGHIAMMNKYPHSLPLFDVDTSLRFVLRQVSSKLKHLAYIHHYEKFEIGQDVFNECFQCLVQTGKDYKDYSVDK